MTLPSYEVIDACEDIIFANYARLSETMRRKKLSIKQLAKAMEASYGKVCMDFQRMRSLEITMRMGRLVRIAYAVNNYGNETDLEYIDIQVRGTEALIKERDHVYSVAEMIQRRKETIRMTEFSKMLGIGSATYSMKEKMMRELPGCNAFYFYHQVAEVTNTTFLRFTKEEVEAIKLKDLSHKGKGIINKEGVEA